MSLTDDSRALADLIDKRLDGDAGSGVGDYLAGAIMGWLLNNGWTKTGSGDPSFCPPLAPGDDETCTHTPTCPTESADPSSSGRPVCARHAASHGPHASELPCYWCSISSGDPS